MEHNKENYFKGLLYAIFCYSAWGVFPLYWKLLIIVPSEQILAHRMIWSMVFLAITILMMRKTSLVSYLRQPRIIGTLILTSILIGLNWGVYIYAVNHEHIVESSLGYYINPLLSVLLGLLFMKERLSKPQMVAVLFALAGLVWLTVDIGRIPWISLSLALTFSLYGFFRKKVNVESMPGLLIETMILAPFALWYLWHVDQNQTGVFLHHSHMTDFLLVLGGLITALPLFMFGMAATRIPLSTLGFVQYLSPTIQLMIGLFVYRETFSTAYFISFFLVWIGVVIYTYSLISAVRERKRITV
ncbi:MAG: EamA family transporter RarD [Bacteroidota bacterium]|nr:EamA family transporter RarD [Bacteroidota bacterium]